MNIKKLVKVLSKQKKVMVNDIIIVLEQTETLNWLKIFKTRTNELVSTSPITDFDDLIANPKKYIPRPFTTKYYTIYTRRNKNSEEN